MTSQEIVLEYNLFDLPSAQHKAGLAGLLVLIESLRQRRPVANDEPLPIPQLVHVSATSARIGFTRESLQTLFDDLYAATTVEVTSKFKRTKEDPKRVEERQVDGKNKKQFVYDDTQPTGAFFAAWLKGGEKSPWLRLWRKMLWGTLRAIPATRGVYDERAEGRPSSEAEAIWGDLTRKPKHPSKSLSATSVVRSIASSMAIGVQDENAERVRFQGAVPLNLLLHFWQLASLIFVPRVFGADGKETFAGFVLAIPEVAALDEFVEAWIGVLSNDQILSDDTHHGWPSHAIVDVPQEAGLEYLFVLSREGARERFLEYLVAGVELYHLQKQGNNVRMLASDRVVPSGRLMKEYAALRETIRNPLFKSLRMKNLLLGRPWFEGALPLMSSERAFWFVPTEGTPRYVPFFGSDVRRKFEFTTVDLGRIEALSDEEVPLDTNDVLARRIYQLVRNFVRTRVRDKDGVEDIRSKPWHEAANKVCLDAFLAVRGRNTEDFIEYFAGTLCSVPQFLKEDEFVALSEALYSDAQKVKTLTLLALSANSWVQAGSEKTENTKKEENAA